MVFFVSATALAQYLWGHSSLIFGRVSGPMHHPNDLGTLLVTVLPVALVLMIACRYWSLSVLLLVLVSALGLTSSRGAWIAFAVSMMALGLCLKRRRVIVVIVFMLAMFLWIFGTYCLSTRVDLYSVSMSQGPVMKPSFANPWGFPVKFSATKLFLGSSGRELYWNTAESVIKKYPWFGCGYNAYVQTLKDLRVGHTEYPHNSLLHITAELGIFGLVFHLWLVVALFLQVRRVLRAVSLERDLHVLGCGIFCGILAWMLHSLVDTPWSSLQLGILLWLLIGILLSLGLIIKPVRKGS
jgi:O-antigen ligase